MGLTNRLFRLFRADLHALLDRMEDPGRLLRQADLEMSEILADDERVLRALRGQRDRVAARLERLSTAPGTAEGDPGESTALEHGSSGVRRQAALLQRGLRELDERIRDLRGVVADRRIGLETVRQQAELLNCGGPSAGNARRDLFIDENGPACSLPNASGERDG